MKNSITFSELKKILKESLDYNETDKISRDVRDWYDMNTEDITDQQLEDICDNKGSKTFLKMLGDLGLNDADDEIKDIAFSTLRDCASTELGIRAVTGY